jgi:hypothetical protein
MLLCLLWIQIRKDLQNFSGSATSLVEMAPDLGPTVYGGLHYFDYLIDFLNSSQILPHMVRKYDAGTNTIVVNTQVQLT